MSAAPAPVICLAGPTAIGKTRVAVRLARMLDAEIVCVDSGVVYCGMDIGTAKPSAIERAAVRHHLIDIRQPDDAYSAAAFLSDATRLIDAIRARSRVPLLVGGTMLYFHVLREGLSALPGADADTRREIENQARHLGWPALHRQLSKIDPEMAAEIHPNHSSRLLRALEIHRLSGQKPSKLRRRRLKGPLAALPEARFLALVPGADRGAYHGRIAARLDAMFEAGLVAETRALFENGRLSSAGPASRLVGYAQALAYLRGEHDEKRMRDSALVATRRLARRQMNWLRTGGSWEMMEIENFEDAREPEAALHRCLGF